MLQHFSWAILLGFCRTSDNLSILSELKTCFLSEIDVFFARYDVFFVRNASVNCCARTLFSRPKRKKKKRKKEKKCKKAVIGARIDAANAAARRGKKHCHTRLCAECPQKPTRRKDKKAFL